MITTNYSNIYLDMRLSSLLTEKLLCSSARKSCFLAFGNCGVLTLKQTNKQTTRFKTGPHTVSTKLPY